MGKSASRQEGNDLDLSQLLNIIHQFTANVTFRNKWSKLLPGRQNFKARQISKKTEHIRTISTAVLIDILPRRQPKLLLTGTFSWLKINVENAFATGISPWTPLRKLTAQPNLQPDVGSLRSGEEMEKSEKSTDRWEGTRRK